MVGRCFATGVRIRTLTPVAYHSLMVRSGTATLPDLIGDRTVAFGLAATWGLLPQRVALPAEPEYRADLGAMPWRVSVFMADRPALLPPVLRRRNLDAEAGYHAKFRSVADRGNLKDFFYTQELVPYRRGPAAHDPDGERGVFRGAVFGADPFPEGESALVIRAGLHRVGMLELTRDPSVTEVRLNAATAALFGRRLAVDLYRVHTIQLTAPMPLAEAAEETASWR